MSRASRTHRDPGSCLPPIVGRSIGWVHAGRLIRTRDELEQHLSCACEQNMKYLLLVYRDEKQWEALSTAERDVHENASLAHEQDLWQSGRLLTVESLHSRRTAITVRMVNGQVALTDGSFIETKEQLSQLFFIKARDLNEAIQVAAKMPQVRTGPIEVRPIIEFDRSLKSN